MPSAKELLDNNWKLTTEWEIHRFFNALNAGDLQTIRKIATKNPKILQWVSNYGSMLHTAAALSTVEVAEYMLSQGFSVDEPHPWHGPRDVVSPPIMRAKSSEMVRFLVERGANVNACAGHWSTPLHHAIGRDDLELVQYLLDHGADANYEDQDGQTPLKWALKCKREAIAALLKQRGAPLKGIPVTKPPVRGTTTIDVVSFAPAIRDLLERAITRYAQEHAHEPLSCAALNASGVHGFVTVCFEPGKFAGDVPSMTYQDESLEIPEWRDAYENAKKVRITPHKGRVVVCTPGETDDEKYQQPFFNFLVQLLHQLEAERRFDPLPRQAGFQIGLEMMDGSFADFWAIDASARGTP